MDKEKHIEIFEKYLKNEASQEEIKLLIGWLKSKELDEWMLGQWKDSKFNSTDFGSMKRDEIFGKIKEEISEADIAKSAPNRPLRRRIFNAIGKVAAVSLLLITTSILTYKYTSKITPLKDTVVTAEKGQRANVVLPDGTIVWLNSESKIVYGTEFSDNERLVKVEGEAYFEVTKDAKRPFIVQLPDLKVKVHGTSFNINTYDEQNTKVALLEGSVELLTKRNKSQILQPNEIATYNSASTQIGVSEGYANEAIDWKYNRLRFKDRPLISIVTELERSFNLEIRMENNKIKNRRFTGDFSQNETIEQILNIMSSNNTFNYSIKGNKIIIY